MFKKYMDLAKINKIIAKQRKLAESAPDTGYSAIISAMLENEAKGVFKNYPEYTRKLVNDFFVECCQKMRDTDLWVESTAKANQDAYDPMSSSNDNLVFCAVIMQAMLCGDLSHNDAKELIMNRENAIKVLVNMKLLPERCLNDCKFEMRVA